MNHLNALMQLTPFAVFGIGVGLGAIVYGLAALLAGRRADSESHERDALARRRIWLKRSAVFLIGSSIATAVVAVALEVTLGNTGLLEAKDAFTLRAKEGLKVERFTDKSSIEAGDLLAEFRSPEMEAEAQAHRRRQRALEETKRVLSATPLEIDPKLAREQQRLDEERRHYLAASERLTMEREKVSREHSTDRVERTQRIMVIDRTLRGLEGDLDQAQSELAKEARELKSNEALFKKQLIAEVAYEAHREDVASRRAAVDKAKRQIAAAREERVKLQKGLEDLADLAREQTAALDAELEETDRKLATLAEEHAALVSALAADRAAAQERRKDELLKIDHEIAEHEATVLGIEQTLRIEAPFAGRIAYRSKAPNSLLPDQPLLVVAPPEAFVVRLRLPVAEAETLAKASPVMLELKRQDVERTAQARPTPPEHLERRFPAELREWHSLEYEPGMALVEMTASPPAEAVRELASGEHVMATLKWMPPLFALPLFLLAAGAGTIGMLGAVLFRTNAEASKGQIEASGIAYPAGGIFQLDRDDDALRLLGAQLKETLDNAEIDRTLLATIEWTIDRRGVNAVRLLAEGFGDQRNLREQLTTVIRAHMRTVSRPGVPRADDDDERPGQLIRILRTIAPGEVSQSMQLAEVVSVSGHAGTLETPHLDLHSGTSG